MRIEQLKHTSYAKNIKGKRQRITLSLKSEVGSAWGKIQPQPQPQPQDHTNPQDISHTHVPKPRDDLSRVGFWSKDEGSVTGQDGTDGNRESSCAGFFWLYTPRKQRVSLKEFKEINMEVKISSRERERPCVEVVGFACHSGGTRLWHWPISAEKKTNAKIYIYVFKKVSK